MAKQMTDAERIAVADVVIENAGSLDDLRTRLTGCGRRWSRVDTGAGGFNLKLTFPRRPARARKAARFL